MSERVKDTRQILRGIQVPVTAASDPGGKGRKSVESLRTFAPGEEDQLEKSLTKEQVDSLKARGAISGNWEAGKKAEAPKAEAPKHEAAKPEAPKVATPEIKTAEAPKKK